MNVIQDHAMRIACSRTVVEDVAKNNSCLSRGDFDGSLDTLKAMGAECILHWSFDKLQIPKSGEFDGKILECFGCLVDYEYVKVNIELMYVDVCFGIYGIAETSKLNDPTEFGQKALVGF